MPRVMMPTEPWLRQVGPRGFSNNVIAAIKQRMEEALSSKDTVRAGWMCEWLANEFNISASRRVLCRVMKPDRGKLGQVFYSEG